MASFAAYYVRLTHDFVDNSCSFLPPCDEGTLTHLVWPVTKVLHRCSPARILVNIWTHSCREYASSRTACPCACPSSLTGAPRFPKHLHRLMPPAGVCETSGAPHPRQRPTLPGHAALPVVPIVDLTCTSLMTSELRHVFAWFWPLGCPLCKESVQVVLPIFSLSCLLFFFF